MRTKGATLRASPKELEARKKLRSDFITYASFALKIRTERGTITPFRLNRVQAYLHERAELQLQRRGYVRIILLKGRQQGCSTYVEARAFHKVTHRRGYRAFILTHQSEATANLYGMARRFHQELPLWLRPQTGASSQRELQFSLLDSGYKVGTAGTEGIGRSDTIQFFHGSEVGFWPHAEEHAAGALQAVPKEANTEVWLESTANGLGNFFHRQWQMAEVGTSEYEAIFIPWFWSDKYTADVPAGFKRESDEQELVDQFELDDGQLQWRRGKIAELGGVALFQQEYPMTAVEAFQATAGDVFIKPKLVMQARKRTVEPHGPLILGIDPARFGDDTSAIYARRGRKAWKVARYVKIDTMDLVGRVAQHIDELKPIRAFLDIGGLGAGVYDRLRELNYKMVVPVNFGERPSNEEDYVNKRAECWGRMRDWLADPAGVQIEDDDVLHADLTGPLYEYDSVQRLRLEMKERMKKRGLRSPDDGDAVALTFAFPVHSPEADLAPERDRYRRDKRTRRRLTSSMAA